MDRTGGINENRDFDIFGPKAPLAPMTKKARKTAART